MKRLNVLGIIIVFSGLCLMPGIAYAEQAQSNSTNDSFTAVAGTDDVVMDRRAENNVNVATGIALAGISLLGLSALSYAIRSAKKPKKTS